MVCTLDNAASATVCDACGGPRPAFTSTRAGSGTPDSGKTTFRTGDHVRIFGLSRAAQYNGAIARVVVPDVGDGTGRAQVELQGSTNRLIVGSDHLELIVDYR